MLDCISQHTKLPVHIRFEVPGSLCMSDACFEEEERERDSKHSLINHEQVISPVA